MEEKTSLNDAQLIDLAKKNPEFFGVLMERYQGPLFHYIRRLTQFSADDIEDLLQEIFIKTYQNLNAYDEKMKFSSWIYRIAHNHIVDHFRKINVRPQTNTLEDYEWEKIIQTSLSVEKEIADKDCVKKIKKCIKALPIKYKEVLILRFVEEKDYEEIMDILKKPKGSVATLISRGREVLKREMKKNNINCH
ncbi:MAG: RNA polymerase sigma factor [Candidatus Moranbacteria bacterium]|jgi:RNA polymerase sigma-70 factor (ECF subfamily)|nr:RNA polymerase sigma factor [Candidatus Moranbacteria bacterium]